MALRISRAGYYHATVQDQPGEAYRLLSQLSTGEVNLRAFNAIPIDANHTQLVLFPEDADALLRVAEKEGLVLVGPHPALLVQGDDELGALVEIHGALYNAKINIASSSGVTDGKGSFGYVIYLGKEDFERAAQILSA